MQKGKYFAAEQGTGFEPALEKGASFAVAVDFPMVGNYKLAPFMEQDQKGLLEDGTIYVIDEEKKSDV